MPNFQPVLLLDPDYCYKFIYIMSNSADPDQLASSTDLDLHCLQRQGISGFSRTRVKCMVSLRVPQYRFCNETAYQNDGLVIVPNIQIPCLFTILIIK